MLEEHHTFEETTVKVAVVNGRILECGIVDMGIAKVAPRDVGITETAVLKGGFLERDTLQRWHVGFAAVVEIAAVQNSLVETAMLQCGILEVDIRQGAAAEVEAFEGLATEVDVLQFFIGDNSLYF